MGNGLAWHPKNIIFSFLAKNPDATPHEIIEYMIQMGYRTWVPTVGQAAWCIRTYRTLGCGDKKRDNEEIHR